MTLRDAILHVTARGDLSEAEAAAVFGTLLSGDATPAQIGAFLVALRMKGETVDELTGAARALRAHAVRVPGVPADAVDTCGTGGDGASTINVSTAAALVAAGAGAHVAKHGNRASSGTVGSADVLETLGVRLELTPGALGDCLREVGFAFMFAPLFHPALRHAAAPRREIGVRTIFNLLGPLANPAGVRRQVIGVPERPLVDLLAQCLARLDVEHVWVVHGGEGIDELGLAGDSTVAEVRGGRVALRTIRAAEVGLGTAPAAALRVRSRDEAALRVRRVLAGEPGPDRDVVCLNAAAALVVAGVAPDLAAGVVQAAAAVDRGDAGRVLERLVEFTTRHGGPAS